jgi:hypothetical protein
MFGSFLFLFFGDSKIPQKEITLKIDVTSQMKIADQKAYKPVQAEDQIDIKNSVQ